MNQKCELWKLPRYEMREFNMAAALFMFKMALYIVVGDLIKTDEHWVHANLYHAMKHKSVSHFNVSTFPTK